MHICAYTYNAPCTNQSSIIPHSNAPAYPPRDGEASLATAHSRRSNKCNGRKFPQAKSSLNSHTSMLAKFCRCKFCKIRWMLAGMLGCPRRAESNGGARGTSTGTTKNCCRSRVIGCTKLKFINNFLSACNASPSAFSILYLVLCPRVRVGVRVRGATPRPASCRNSGA